MAMMRLRREDPRVVGSFKLHRRLGAGGMGVVYLGSDKRGQRVALKVIRPDLAEDQEFRHRFAREVSAARRIRGGCTARLVAADLEAERPWFATQYVPGPSLHDKVQADGPLPAAQVASVGAALAEGLVAVHEAGVVHRDVKPSNILLSPKGPRIIDFGIAWATGASTLTHVGTAVGSPGFLAPEQVRGAAVTPATDVFSLGATLAYAATADSPFGQGSSEVMLYRVVHEEPQLYGVHAALAPLIQACLVKDPDDRPSTLQLSLRLKEIAAREARGAAEHVGGAGPLGTGWGGGTPSAAARAAAAGQDTVPGDGRPAARTDGDAYPPGAGRGPSAPRQRGGADRFRGRRTEGRAQQRTERHNVEPGHGHGQGHGGEHGVPRDQAHQPEHGRDPGHAHGSGQQGQGHAPYGHGTGSGARRGPGTGGASGGRARRGESSGTPSAPRASQPRTGGRSRGDTGRGEGRTSGNRPGAARTGQRTGGRGGPRTGGQGRRPGVQRPGRRRMIRQRLIVFFTVTLLVALGIAAAQGCQGPTDGLGLLHGGHAPAPHSAPLPPRGG